MGVCFVATETVFPCDPNDSKFLQELDGLLGEFGVSLPQLPSDNFRQLLENLFWRKRKTASAGDSDRGGGLHEFLDLGESDEVLLATIRAGEVSTFGHAALYASEPEGAPVRAENLG